MREAAKRVLGQRHFDVQMIGGMVLHEGAIAEMRTGEGKTLVATLATYLNALATAGACTSSPSTTISPGATPSGWGRVYTFLGLTVGVIVHGLDDTRAQGGLRGRHYLRDEQRVRLRLPARQHEVRDEPDGSARAQPMPSSTRWIRSSSTRPARRSSSRGRRRISSDLYNSIDKLIPKLVREDYDLDEKQRTTNLTEAGNEHIEALADRSRAS